MADFIDYALKNVGSYNVIFKHAKWAWLLFHFSRSLLYFFIIWVNLVFAWYLYMPPQILWGLLLMVPLLVSVFVFEAAPKALIRKHYPSYRKEKNWGVALEKIENGKIKGLLKTLKCYSRRGIQLVTEMVFKEEQSLNRFSFFKAVYIRASFRQPVFCWAGCWHKKRRT